MVLSSQGCGRMWTQDPRNKQPGSSEPRTGKNGTERMLAEWGTAQDPANPAQRVCPANWKGEQGQPTPFIHPFLNKYLSHLLNSRHC